MYMQIKKLNMEHFSNYGLKLIMISHEIEYINNTYIVHCWWTCTN